MSGDGKSSATSAFICVRVLSTSSPAPPVPARPPCSGPVHVHAPVAWADPAFGQDVSRINTAKRAPLRRRIGIVFQDFRLLEHLTTWENVALLLRVIGKRVEDYREDVTDLLQWVGLGDRMHGYPSVLSGGEKQRAAIARAVIGKPELLLADEPTGNVDPQMARRLLRLFIELNRLGTSVLIATHDHQLMRQFKAPRLELHDGHVRIA